ncbi:TetR/AcrR family transcriptional regulator [Stappia sp. ES.058]|uniref:TetR/AcrR family transcriptional regulator n=1 Tax=Stappia sp. ES.058 TaxID=1881061 RepID=UPI00087B8D72|nr:TetR/AcrR family transcriptional regulator [Stappia sp. ES.058]SDU37187.1 transcriptional regulator, TetR family [Stappia sp. ES.058]
MTDHTQGSSAQTEPTAAPGTAGRALATASDLLRASGPDHVTVTEIARRLGMSHSNIYRFYSSKADLLDAVMAAWLGEIETALDEALASVSAPADRLASYVLTFSDEMHGRASADPRGFAAYAALSERAEAAMGAHATACRKRVEAILADGMAQGVFADGDASAVARAIDNATLCLRHPKLVHTARSQASGEDAEDLVILILDGIRR